MQNNECKNLRKLITGLDYITLTGYKDHNDLPQEYKNCDLFVLSSTNESFGKVLVEANACSKPVISTKTTGAQQIVQDGVNGFLVPIGDSQAIANAILELLSNPAKAQTMGQAGRQMAKQRFSNNTEKIAEFWRDIIENKL